MIIEEKDMNIKKSKLTITISKCAVAVMFLGTFAALEGHAADSTNYTGNNKWGNCQNKMPNGDTGSLVNQSQTQCAGTFANCDQPYAWPYYYYDKFMSRAMKEGDPDGKSSIEPENLKSTALKAALDICQNATATKWAGTQDKVNCNDGVSCISFPQIASVWKAAAEGTTYEGDNICAEAIIVAAGECQNPSKENIPDGWKGACLVTGDYLWGMGFKDPDKEAAGVMSEDQLGNCNKASTIPDKWISAGNSNFIDKVFCHMNAPASGGVEFGGGMCSGGASGGGGGPALSIHYTGTNAKLSCQIEGSSNVVLINKDATTQIPGSASAAKVTCYGTTTLTYNRTGDGDTSSWSGENCRKVDEKDYTCDADN